ncbi:MAG: hypothetical protein LBN06_08825 [Prevotellaceae bacterium]|jgi:hypothetical protein|nr:hypothetical protein [Prevotellaceae bacterium]
MAIDTFTRLLTFDRNDADYVVIENELNRCRRHLAGKRLQPATFIVPLDEGEIEVTVTSYKENLYQIDLSAVSAGKHHRIRYRYLQANP